MLNKIEMNKSLNRILSTFQKGEEQKKLNKKINASLKKTQKIKSPVKSSDLKRINSLMQCKCSTKTIKSKQFYEKFVNYNFKSYEDKQSAFQCWFRLNTDKDTRNALFYEVITNEQGDLNTLERSIAIGKKQDFPFHDFVQTELGFTHKMLINNASS